MLKCIDFGSHDKVGFAESLDFVSCEMNCRIAPAEVHIGMVSLGFSKGSNAVDKIEGFLKVLKLVGAF